MKPPAPKWTPTGRWSEDGRCCFALLQTWKQAQWGDRLIYGRRDFTMMESTDAALNRMMRSWE
jgi:hypothetical protein